MAVVDPGISPGSPPSSPPPDVASHEFRTRRVNLSLNPTNDDLELAGEVKRLFFMARAARRPVVAQWYKNYRIMRNRTWVNGRPDWLPAPEIPEIFPIVASMVGWSTDQRPSLEVAPAAFQGSDFYKVMSQTSDDLQVALYSAWFANGWDAEVEKTIWDQWVYGTGILKTVWNDALDDGVGNVDLSRVDPYSFYPDPHATNMKDANFFIEARTVSMQELDRRFPGISDRIQSGWVEDVDVQPSKSDMYSGRHQPPFPGPISPSTSARFGRPGAGRQQGVPEDPGVTYFECWLREHEIDDTDPDDIVIHDIWRVVVVVGNYILMDERADDLWSHGKHPYVRLVAQDTGEFWGLSLVELLAPSQLAINRLLAALQHNVELVGNPIFLEGSRSGIQRQAIVNKPGSRHTVAENSTHEWLMPPQVHPMMMGLIQFYRDEMERISGLSAVNRGMTPQGRNAQGVIDSVQEAGFVRVRMGLRNLEYALREVGNLASSLIVEYYDTPRFVAVLGPEGEQSARLLKANHFYVPGPNGATPFKYVLQVNAGSQMSTSATQRRADAVQLFAMKAIDHEAVLEAFKWPNRQKVAARVTAMLEQGLYDPAGMRQRTGRTT